MLPEILEKLYYEGVSGVLKYVAARSDNKLDDAVVNGLDQAVGILFAKWKENDDEEKPAEEKEELPELPE